jgi:3-methyladenine DNA glycosylase AlkD
MTHAFQYVLMKYPENLQRIKKWVNHEKFAVRRSSPVILIRPAQKSLLNKKIIFEVCDLLKNDEHYLVQKGYGWLLKESVKMYHDSVIKYLEDNVDTMSRTAFRYALEKLPKEEKEELMEI